MPKLVINELQRASPDDALRLGLTPSGFQLQALWLGTWGLLKDFEVAVVLQVCHIG